jgi:hypothetical protein
MKIHPITSPYTDDDQEFYVSLPEEFPAEKTVECPSTGNDINVEYHESEEDDVVFEVLIDKAEELEEEEKPEGYTMIEDSTYNESEPEDVSPPEEIFGDQ